MMRGQACFTSLGHENTKEMDGSSSTSTNGNSSNGTNRNSGRQGGGVADKVGTTAVNRESDVKKDMGPAVSSTYVAETMTVINNFNF